MQLLSTLFNGLLVSVSAYTLFQIAPAEYPYIFTAAAFSICHGTLSLVEALKGEKEEGCSKAVEVSRSIMSIVPLPLINIDLFGHSDKSSALALGHGIFVIPLCFELISKLFADDEEDTTLQALIDLTIIGNITSCLFLAANEEHYMYLAIASSAFVAKFGHYVTDSWAEDVFTVGTAAMIGVAGEVCNSGTVATT